MNPRQLQQFIAVAEELHFGRAADRLNMAQPPLTMAIRKLETELDTPLLTRTSRQVALTPAGTVFLAEARAILRSLDVAAERTRKAADRTVPVLTLGHLPASSVLPSIVRELRQTLPRIDLRLIEATTAEQLDLLTRGRLDVAIVRPPKRPPTGVLFRTIDRHPLVTALAADHRLADHAAIALPDLAGETFVGTPADETNGLDHAVAVLCRKAGVDPTPVQIAREIPSLMTLVAAGIGVAIVPEPRFVLGYRGVVTLPLAPVGTEDAPTIDLQAAWLPSNPSAALADALDLIAPALPA